jgi:YD repeat-containing protein
MSKGIFLPKKCIFITIFTALCMCFQSFSISFAYSMDHAVSSPHILHPASITAGYGHTQAGRYGSNSEYIFHPTSQWTSILADLKSGNVLFHVQLPKLDGISLPIPLEMTYNSFNATENIGLGNGWILSYLSCLQEDSQTQNVRYIDPSGAILSFTYDAVTQSYSNPFGFKGKLQKNPDNSFTLKLLNNISYEFDTQGKLSQVKSPQGFGYSVSYANNLPVEIKDDIHSSIQYTLSWNAGGMLQSITDGMNQTWNLSYDTNEDALTSIQKPGSTQSCGFSYDTNFLLVQHLDFAGFEYDIDYSLVAPYPIASWTIPSGDTTTFQFTTASSPYAKKTEVKDAENKIVDYFFGASSSHLEKISQTNGGVESKQTISYTQQGWVSRVQDSNGINTDFTYDNVGHLISHKDAPPSAGNDYFEMVYTYFPQDSIDGKLISFKEKATPSIWNETTYQYNDVDAPNLTSGITNSLGETTTYDYNPLGQMISSTIPTKTGTATTTYQYNPTTGFLSQIIFSDGNESSFQYNHNGYVTTANQFEGSVQMGIPIAAKAYTYDSTNRITQTIDSITNDQTSHQYGSNGEILSWTSETGCTETFSYTQTIGENSVLMSNRDIKAIPMSIYANPHSILNMGFQSSPQSYVPKYSPNPYSTTNSYGHQTIHTYYDNGYSKSQTNHLGNTTTYSYDAFYNKNSIIYPDGATTQITYNNNNLPTSSTNSKKGVTSWQYNDIGRVTVENHPIKGTIQYLYSIRGDVLSDETGTYSYDLIGRKTAINYIGGGSDTWSYTPDGYKETSSGIQYTYTSTGNVYSWQEGNNGVTYNYQGGYSKLHLPSSITGSGELSSYSYQYDNNHRMHSVNNTSKTLQGSFVYTYNDQYQLTSITNPNDTQYIQTYSNKIHDQSKVLDSTGQIELMVTDTQFNGLDQRTNYQHTVVAGQNQFTDSHSIQYFTSGSHTGKLQSITTASTNQTYTYSYSQTDGLLQTIQDSLLGTYTIQRSVANHTISEITYPGGVGNATFDYGASLGKLSSISFPGNKSMQLSWDSKNQITNVSYTEMGSMISYGIDYNKRGQMTSLTTYQDGMQLYRWTFHHGPNGLEKAYRYAPNQALQITQSFTTDPNGRILSMTYTDHTPAGFQNNGEYYFHNDNLGNVVLITDQMGDPIASYEYDIFNNKLKNEWNPQNIVNPFLQKGIKGTPVLPLGTTSIDNEFIYTPPWKNPEVGTDPGVIIIGHPNENIDFRGDFWGNKDSEGYCAKVAVLICCYTCYEYIIGDDPPDPDDPEIWTVEYAEEHSGDEIETLCLIEEKKEKDQKCAEVCYTVHQEYDNGKKQKPIKMVCILSEQREGELEY